MSKNLCDGCGRPIRVTDASVTRQHARQPEEVVSPLRRLAAAGHANVGRTLDCNVAC